MDPSRTLLRRVLGNSAWLLSADVVAMGLRAVEGFIVAAALGAAELGVLAVVVAFVSTAFQLLDFRVWEVITKNVIDYRSRGETDRARALLRVCFGLNGAAAVLTFVVVWLTAPLAVSLFTGDPAAAGYVRFLAIGTLFTGPITSSSALLRVSNSFRVLAIKEIGVGVVRFTAVVGSLSLRGTIESVLVPLVLVGLADAVVSGVLARRAIDRLGLAGWSRQPLAPLAPEKQPLVRLFLATNVSATLKLFQGQVDILLLGWLLPNAEVGQYRVARSVSEIMRILVGGVYMASFPEFARLWVQRRHAALRRLATSLLRIMAGLGVLAGTTVFLAAPLIPRVLGAEYAVSATILRWMALGTALEVGSAVFHPLLFATDRARSSAIALACGVTAQLSLLAALAVTHGVAATGIPHIAFFVAWLAVVIPSAISADREAARWPTPVAGAPS